jgi:hypothetical protein
LKGSVVGSAIDMVKGRNLVVANVGTGVNGENGEKLSSFRLYFQDRIGLSSSSCIFIMSATLGDFRILEIGCGETS